MKREKSPIHVKRDLYMWKETLKETDTDLRNMQHGTSSGGSWCLHVKRDLYVGKETLF